MEDYGGWDVVGGMFKREVAYIYLWLIHVNIWQKPTQYCKAITYCKATISYIINYPPIKNIKSKDLTSTSSK